ncbi:MAG: efflux RND transporter periplasmic adaptor subunit [Verrucomicrobiota bacterium]|jgi:multidrug efflux system membrane fusion protein
MKKFLFLSTFALAAAMLANGCSRGNGNAGVRGVPVLVARAFTTNVPVQIDPPPVGHVEAYTTVTIRPQIGGILSEVHFQEGQEVKQGDPLFTIDPRPSQAALEGAQAALKRDTAQLENARIQFDREQKLFAQKLVSQDEFDTSRAAMDALQGTVLVDQANVTNAELNVSFCQIRSPIDGVAGALQFFRGNVVKAPDDTLLTINQIHPIYVQFGVPEQFLPEIRKEMREHPLKVSALFDSLDGPPPEGELTFIDNSVDPTTGMIQLKATFANTRGLLWPGQFVNVTLTLSELIHVVVVPSQAVQTGQNGEYLYAVKSNQGDQVVEEQPIVVGVSYQGMTVVKNGVQAGEVVVTDGQLRLSPGLAVTIKNNQSTNAPVPAP